MTAFDIDKKLEGITDKNPEIPKGKLREVYDEIIARSIKLRPGVPMERKELVAYANIRNVIATGYPISYCPHCPYYTDNIHQLQTHLEKQHNWAKGDLDRVRKGFFAAKDKKRLDYSPKPPV